MSLAVAFDDIGHAESSSRTVRADVPLGRQVHNTSIGYRRQRKSWRLGIGMHFHIFDLLQCCQAITARREQRCVELIVPRHEHETGDTNLAYESLIEAPHSHAG